MLNVRHKEVGLLETYGTIKDLDVAGETLARVYCNHTGNVECSKVFDKG